MDSKDVWHEFKCFGSATVGPRGQVVIPANARKELHIDKGDTLLVFSGPGRRGLVLLKADAVEQIVGMLSERLSSIEKSLKNYVPSEAANENLEGVNAKEKE